MARNPILTELSADGTELIEVIPLSSRAEAYRVRAISTRRARQVSPNEGTVRYTLDGAISEAARLLVRSNPEVLAAEQAYNRLRSARITEQEVALMDRLAADTVRDADGFLVLKAEQ